MKNASLVIMAAGIGSRFGEGVKQLEPVGPNGQVIMDYSIYDALEAGFNKVIFIIRKEIEQEFKEIIGDRIAKRVPVHYVFQELDDLPIGYKKPENRIKPWGTGQAILCAKSVLSEPFLVINADDYYGKEGFFTLYQYLTQEMDPESVTLDLCMAGFVLRNTLSENGGVTRGVCKMDESGALERVIETYEISEYEEEIVGQTEAKELVTLPEDSLVSMNMWGFSPAFIHVLEQGFVDFLETLHEEDIKSEYLLPKIVDQLVQSGRARVKVLKTADRWFGVTYKEDKSVVVAAISTLIDQGLYK